MSTHWRCAVCEAVNEGGDACAACGARVTQTVTQAPAGTDIPVRELPRRGRLEPDRPDDVYDLFDLAPAYDPDATYEGYERIATRPRVRVYGCCLPIALGMLLAVLATVTLLANLLLAAR
jgi:hypothetical protein